MDTPHSETPEDLQIQPRLLNCPEAFDNRLVDVLVGIGLIISVLDKRKK
jgi:hypothetical protein